MIRAQFLILALLSVHVLLGALCLTAARGERQSDALRWWGWGLIVYSMGLAFTLGRFLPSPQAGTFVGNSLIALSSAMAIRGVLPYASRSLDWRVAGAGIAVTVVALAVANFGDVHERAVNIVAPTVIASLFFAFAAAMLLRHPPADAVRAGRFVAFTLVAAIVIWWTRVGALSSLFEEPVDFERFDIVMSLFAIAQILVGVAAAFGLLWVEVQLMQSAMARIAFTDPLTGLANRRAIVGRFDEEVARARRSGLALALVVYDIDLFKEVNDRHGHLAGDALLRHVGGLLAAGKRTEEALGRIGGEEFVLLMEGTAPGSALAAADRLRERVSSSPLAYEGQSLAVTLSGGLALYPEDGANWDTLFAAADGRLYEAKRSGRNRVVGKATGA
jgi:diguanylate cyclase (GGDEF)-like protein